MTEIEQFIFGRDTPHVLLKMEWADRQVSLVVQAVPVGAQGPIGSPKRFVFDEAKLVYKERVDPQDEGEVFPQGIIGFHSSPCDMEYFEFLLHTDEMETAFKARWPVYIVA